jgi:hypothetical protein
LDAVIVHNVSLEWKDGVGEEEVAAVGAALDKLGALAEVEFLARGPQLGLNPATADTCDYGFSIHLTDRAAMAAYLVHPDHAALGELLAPLIAGRMSVQIEA